MESLQDNTERVVAENIKAIRKEKGISQDALAELAGLDRVHLYRLENGKQSMTLGTLKLIADTLGVRVRDLIGEL
ncbi:MAG: helix-turn-helix transcriptional regulator [Bryobacteraceae bacterium]